MSDDELWDRSREGDGHAFGLLFDRHGNRVFRHACRLVESRQDAEDVTAAAFLELWRRRNDVRLVDGSVLPWLLVTTGNLASNARRATWRYRRFLSRLPSADDEIDAAELALGGMLDPHLRAALLRLNPLERSVIALVGIEGLSLREAGDALSITAAAAKARYHRARHALRDDLIGSELTPPGWVLAGEMTDVD